MSITEKPYWSTAAPHAGYLTLGLLVGCLWAASSALAQTTAPTSSIAPSARPNGAAPVAPRDVLSDDPRLDSRVTMLHRVVSVRNALQELTEQTGVRLAAAGNEAPTWQVAVAVRDEPLRGVLRALADACYCCHWKRVKAADGRDVLSLMDMADDPRYWDFLRPRTQAEADLHRGVEDFQRQSAQLPLDAQQALSPGGKGVPYASLPPGMQQSVQQSFAAYLQILASRHGNLPMNEDSLGGMRVTLGAAPQEGMTQYDVRVRGALVPEGDGSYYEQDATMSASVPDNPSALDDTVQPPGFVPWQRGQPQAEAARIEALRRNALRGDPRLSRPVSVKTEDTTLGFALAALADAAHVNVVAQVYPGSHTVSLASMPLGDALDRITAKYRAVWGEAADGTILVRYNEYPQPEDKQAAK